VGAEDVNQSFVVLQRIGALDRQLVAYSLQRAN
jgi:hypothetical protein